MRGLKSVPIHARHHSLSTQVLPFPVGCKTYKRDKPSNKVKRRTRQTHGQSTVYMPPPAGASFVDLSGWSPSQPTLGAGSALGGQLTLTTCWVRLWFAPARVEKLLHRYRNSQQAGTVNGS